MFGRIMKRLKIVLCITAALGCWWGPAALAHPHAFVTCTVSFVMDGTGLVGCRHGS
jgi:ABC-type uncharacterized transport system substrate-binding protein